MGARYPYYLLADSPEGKRKEAEILHREIVETPTRGDIRQGFVYERMPHITLQNITENSEINVIWDTYQEPLNQLLPSINEATGNSWDEWAVPREGNPEWSTDASTIHQEWWKQVRARQGEINASIDGSGTSELLFDHPVQDKNRVRVAGPFTVESLSPHRLMVADDGKRTSDGPDSNDGFGPARADRDFAGMILDNLRTSGVQQAHKEDKIDFSSVTGWPGDYICAEGRFLEGEKERRAGIFVGPEFVTVTRTDLSAAAQEAGLARFDLLIACAFNFDAYASNLTKIDPLAILKARMNADLHMASDLKNDGKGNLFVVFGEPDVEMLHVPSGNGEQDLLQLKILGIDMFDPATGQVRSQGAEGVACWFIDTDYNEESFFVRHAYFLGTTKDTFRRLRNTLQAEIDEETWDSLRSDTSRPFARPKSGRIAVKVINHLGDEAIKVFSV